ncbi:MAG: lamin tail domain-containing protein, partial [Planctomycetales bacterium]|nr:lamin tail domain-containing protein [Planctomycetales bacterium]
IDDGVVVYLNGIEVLRLGLPDGDIDYVTLANRGVGNAHVEGPFTVPRELLRDGDNVIAAEVHQLSSASADVVFGLTLDGHAVRDSAEVAHWVELMNGLRITEIMYNPGEDAELEFLELQNTSSEPLDIAGVRLGGGIEFTFPAITLAPDQYVVAVRDLDQFRSHYGSAIEVAGEYAGQLSNSGERLELLLPDPQQAMILRFDYDDQWYVETDGGGYSLEFTDVTVALALWGDATSWRVSLQPGGSPGGPLEQGVSSERANDTTRMTPGSLQTWLGLVPDAKPQSAARPIDGALADWIQESSEEVLPVRKEPLEFPRCFSPRLTSGFVDRALADWVVDSRRSFDFHMRLPEAVLSAVDNSDRRA